MRWSHGGRRAASAPGLQLWHAYLGERRLAARGAHLSDPQLVKLNGTYERALVSMHKMPRIWTDVSGRAARAFTLSSRLLGGKRTHGALRPVVTASRWKAHTWEPALAWTPRRSCTHGPMVSVRLL